MACKNAILPPEGALMGRKCPRRNRSAPGAHQSTRPWCQKPNEFGQGTVTRNQASHCPGHPTPQCRSLAPGPGRSRPGLQQAPPLPWRLRPKSPSSSSLSPFPFSGSTRFRAKKKTLPSPQRALRARHLLSTKHL